MRGREPVPIQRILKDVLSRRGLTAGRERLTQVKAAFEAALDPRLRGRARVIAIQGTTITVEADTSGLAYELKAFHARKLLKDIQGEPGGDFVTKLRFRAGAVADGG